MGMPADELPPSGAGLCLSGGGYRAMLFHAGVIWRLYEAGVLQRLDRIASVSGGSLTAAVLALAWPRLSFAPIQFQQDFVPHFVTPLRRLAGETIDVQSVFEGILTPGTINDKVEGLYDDFLFHGATLQNLPERPRFILNATNVQTGSLWRFSRPFMGDYQVGRIPHPTLSLSKAVAASSAFPPFLSPAILPLDETTFDFASLGPLGLPPYTTRAVLSDGGVYDNLALEPVYKRCATVFVSDAGAKLHPEPEPKEDWIQHATRVALIADNQVRSLRKRHLIDAYKRGERKGCYWGIRTEIEHYLAPGKLVAPREGVLELADLDTRLAALPAATQERLINWGYAVSDAALRTHHDTTLLPGKLPYPTSPI